VANGGEASEDVAALVGATEMQMPWKGEGLLQWSKQMGIDTMEYWGFLHNWICVGYF
jgi:hypothetical protein